MGKGLGPRRTSSPKRPHALSPTPALPAPIPIAFAQRSDCRNRTRERDDERTWRATRFNRSGRSSSRRRWCAMRRSKGKPSGLLERTLAVIFQGKTLRVSTARQTLVASSARGSGAIVSIFPLHFFFYPSSRASVAATRPAMRNADASTHFWDRPASDSPFLSLRLRDERFVQLLQDTNGLLGALIFRWRRRNGRTATSKENERVVQPSLRFAAALRPTSTAFDRRSANSGGLRMRRTKNNNEISQRKPRGSLCEQSLSFRAPHRRLPTRKDRTASTVPRSTASSASRPQATCSRLRPDARLPTSSFPPCLGPAVPHIADSRRKNRRTRCPWPNTARRCHVQLGARGASRHRLRAHHSHPRSARLRPSSA